MAYPDLYNDESKILEAQNVKVKSVTFEVVLTNRRLILIDSKKQMVPPQEVLLATVKNVDSGENAIRDPTITLSIMTNTGTTRQMILTFSSKTSTKGERKREVDEWVHALRQNLSATVGHMATADIPAPEEEVPAPVPPQPVKPVTPLPKISIVSTPPPQKKKIEISRPNKTIIETEPVKPAKVETLIRTEPVKPAPVETLIRTEPVKPAKVETIIRTEPVMPAPVETSSLPAGTFCNRCGSRVPPESEFCNRCGTPVVKEDDLDSALDKIETLKKLKTEPEPVLHKVPQATVTPTFRERPGERERKIDEVIHSIEPLIVDSVPRKHEQAVLKPVPPKPIVTDIPTDELSAAPAAEPADGVQWPVITSGGEPAAPPEPAGETLESPAPPVPPIPPAPFMPEDRPRGRGTFIAIAVAAIVIIAIIAGVVIFANPFGSGTTTPEPTPVPTTVATIVATPVPTTLITTIATPTEPTPVPTRPIPDSGVWVRINYPNEFTASIGTAGAVDTVRNTGEQFYRISTSTGTVVATVQKVDGSGDLMTVELFKDGELVAKRMTTAPKGIIEIQESLKPPETPTPAPTTVPTTAIPETTGNSTATNQTAGE